MIRYAGLYGNIKKPRIKSQGDNSSTFNTEDLVHQSQIDVEHINHLDATVESTEFIVEPYQGVDAIETMINRSGKSIFILL